MKIESTYPLVLALQFGIAIAGAWAAPVEGVAAGSGGQSSSGSAYANVKNYGAQCDGITDDSVAIQSALESGLPILIPIGVCRVSTAIYFGGARIMGASLSGSVLRWTGQAPTMPVSVTSSSVTGGVATVNTSVAQSLWPHETVVVQGNSNAVFNGAFVVQAVPSATSFTYTLNTPDTVGSGGTAGMYYLLDGSKVPSGESPVFLGYNAGWLSNLTIDCNSTPGLSGLLQYGDSGDAINLHILNCLDGYTAVQTYMNPMSHVVINNSSGQGAFIKNASANNGAATGGSIWANGFGTYGIHVRGTLGVFDLMYAQHGATTAIYPIFFEGDGPGVTRSANIQCNSCVADGANGVNSFYIRRYYFELDSPQVATTGPSQDDFVLDDAWGTIVNAQAYPTVAPGYYTFKSLGNTAGLTGDIVLMGGSGTIDPINASDFTAYGFATSAPSSTSLLPAGSASDPSLSFSDQPGLGWYQGENGMVALASQGVAVFSASTGGVTTISKFNFCFDPVAGPCYGALGQNGLDEIGAIDHFGTWGGGNFTAKILKLGVLSNDTGISRIAAGAFAFGNGTQGDMSGTVYASKFVTSGSSAPVGTAACYKSDMSLGYCTTPFSGTPPTCTCQSGESRPRLGAK